jgi:hypothetical protein
MTEERKTMVYGGIAVFLVLVAFLTAPGNVTPEDFLDRDEPFFPDFTDPNAATTLEVIDFDEATGTARPFKVTFNDGTWTIPSHHEYPADGKDRLAQTAAGLIDIKKDDYRSNIIADHEALGVVDPLDESVSTLSGRGKRVTVRDENDQVLADLIVGNEPDGRPGLRFVRLPEQTRVYVSRMDMDISTQFQDWIERDLLQVDRDKLDRLLLKDYSINERTGSVNQRDTLTLEKVEDTWRADRMAANQEVAANKMNDLLGELDGLSIVGVRPKPEGLSQSLMRSSGGITISQSDLLSLRGAGYYFANTGQLLSNEGELEARDSEGVTYTLRFGEVLYGTGDDVSAGSSTDVDDPQGPGENRYLFITTTFDPRLFPEPAEPSNTGFAEKAEDDWTDADRRNKERRDAHDEWQKKVEDGQARSDDLNARFADWYYVISAESFDKIRLTRSDLVQRKEEETDSN